MAVVIQYLLYFLIASILVSMIRVVIGPSLTDRLIGLNLVSAQTLAILVLLSVSSGRNIYLDVALVYDIFGFVGILALVKYFTGRKKEIS